MGIIVSIAVIHLAIEADSNASKNGLNRYTFEH
jgi:hypothetical protein